MVSSRMPSKSGLGSPKPGVEIKPGIFRPPKSERNEKRMRKQKARLSGRAFFSDSTVRTSYSLFRLVRDAARALGSAAVRLRRGRRRRRGGRRGRAGGDGALDGLGRLLERGLLRPRALRVARIAFGLAHDESVLGCVGRL